MRLLVSIHDVTPAFADEVETLWDICASRGVPAALFVVPNWHGEWRLADDPRFCGWLRKQQAAGAEVFLHGERHDEAGSPRRVRDELHAWWRTAREGEFLTLSRDTARNRIARGLRLLRSVGLDPIGFVAPAWLWRRESAQAVRDVGLRYSEDESSVHLHELGMRVASPVIRWSARTPVRARISVVVAAAARAAMQESLVRVALHPADLRSAPVRQSLLRTLDVCLERAWPTQYCAI
jgi:predicted deacetylase